MPFSEIDRWQHDEGVEEAEGGGRGGVGQVVGRDVDGLHRGDRAFVGRGDPLLQGAHLGGQGRLIADVRRHPAQQGRDFGAGLAEPEDVVDEQQGVGPGRVAEPLGHRQGREGDPQPGAGGLVHLAEAHDRAVDDRLAGAADLGLLHFEPEVVPLAGPLADAGEDREAAVHLGDAGDQLGQDDRLAQPGAAEEADLAAADERGEQVDDLDAGLELLGLGRELVERRRVAVDRPALATRRPVPGRRSGRPAG